MAAPATYERLRSKGYPWKRVNEWHKNGRPKVSPDSFQYALRFTLDGVRWFTTFKTVEALMIALGRVQVQLHAAKKGVQLLNPVETKRSDKQEMLVSAVQRYTDEIKANKTHRTWTAYRNSLRHFLASCRKTTVQQVEREDLLALKVYCKTVQKHADGTVYNNFLNTMVFFKWAGHPTGVKAEDWPKKPKPDPEEFSDEELEAMFKVADAEERLILKSFLFSAMREGELAHLTYGDIDFHDSLWRVRKKAASDWELKTPAAQREVPVNPKHTEKIHERMKANSKKPTDLIFPNRDSEPDKHLLRIVKKVAKRAGLDTTAYCHKFRSTQITRWLREGCSPTDVVRWVGHENLDTIMIYAAKVDLRNKQKRAKAGLAKYPPWYGFAGFRRFAKSTRPRLQRGTSGEHHSSHPITVNEMKGRTLADETDDAVRAIPRSHWRLHPPSIARIGREPQPERTRLSATRVSTPKTIPGTLDMCTTPRRLSGCVCVSARISLRRIE